MNTQHKSLSLYPLTALDTYDVWVADRGRQPVRLDATMRECVTLAGVIELLDAYGDLWDEVRVIQRLATGVAIDVSHMIAHRIAEDRARQGFEAEAIMRLPIVSANFTNAELDALCAVTERKAP